MSKHFLCFLFLIGTHYSYSSSISFKEPKAVEVFFTLPGTSIRLGLADYIKLNFSDFKELTGKKLTLKEAIAFKISQKQIKKTIRKNGTVDLTALHQKSSKSFKWHWGGFFLGMLFPIGFIIALCINDEKRKDRSRSALFGLATALLIAVLIGIMIGPIGI